MPSAAGTFLQGGLPGLHDGGSVQRVLKVRLAMVEAGHSVPHDLRRHRGYLAHQAHYFTSKALEFVKTPKLDPERKAYRQFLAKAAAHLIAEIDRTDAELAGVTPAPKGE